MRDAFAVLRAALRDMWSDVWTVALCNLLWLFSLLLVIPGPPATVAIFYYGNRVAHGEVADVSDFLNAVRRYWGTGWRWGSVNIALIAILAGDFVLTGRLSQSNSARFVQGFYLAALAAWMLVQLYALPFLFEQESASVRQALRNGAVMVGRNPLFSAGLALLLFGTLLVGTVLFMISFAAGGVLLAVVGNRAVINRLAIRQA